MVARCGQLLATVRVVFQVGSWRSEIVEEG
jgi:hypothetical protein